MLEFQDCGVTQYLSDYGFAGQTTSWVNTRHSGVVHVRDSSYNFLWSEPTTSESSNVGAANNDRANEFKIYCS
jgi:hypothetical protein